MQIITSARYGVWIGWMLGQVCLAQLKVGVGSAVITPDLEKHAPVYMAGFGQNRVATGVHDPLYARCMAVQVARQPLVMCGVDSIGLFLDDVEKIRARIAGKAVIAALHDHEAPDTLGLWGPAQGKSGINEAYNQFVIDGTVAAAQQAINAMKAARVKLARVQDAELDTFIHDTRPPVRHDSDLVILSAEDLNGKPIGTLINWANHPETLGSRNTMITADYSGYLRQHLEAQLGGTAVFINGAVGGMQSPLGAKLDQLENSFERAEWIGRRVAEMAAKAVKTADQVEIDGLSFRETTLDIPLSNAGFRMAAELDLYKGRKKLNANGWIGTLVGYVKLSGNGAPLLEIAMIPGEMYPELSVGGIERYAGADYPEAALEPGIKQQMKAPFRMLFGLANDEIGYIIPKAEWDKAAPWLNNSAKRWYGEVNSVGEEAGPLINQAFAELVKEK